MANTIIIGNGPAGISTALYTTRAGIDTTVIGKDYGALEKTSEIENYYGFRSPISGNDLVADGIEGARRLGANMIQDEVVGITFKEKLTVITQGNEYPADSVVIATGASRTAPKIHGLTDLEGRGVSYCAVCDAFFYREKDVAVLGNGNYALHEALALLPTSKSVTILTNGTEPEVTIPDTIKLDTRLIQSVEGTDVVTGILFQDNQTLPVSGVFVAIGVAGSADLVKNLGAEIRNSKIVVDENMATNIPGLYAAGDCTGGLLQISKAVYEGAKAGMAIIKYVRNNAS